MFKRELNIPAFRIKSWIIMSILFIVIVVMTFSFIGAPVSSVKSAPPQPEKAWEYLAVNMRDWATPDKNSTVKNEVELFMEKCNKLGVDGWELIILSDNALVFKRPKIDL